MMSNFLFIKYDKEIVELNKKTLTINYIIGGINDIHKKEIIDAVKTYLYEFLTDLLFDN